MNTVGEHVYFMQLYVAASDGEIEDEEIDNLLGQMIGNQIIGNIIGDGTDQGQCMTNAREYFMECARAGTLDMAFSMSAGGMAASVGWDYGTLEVFFNELMSTAFADGELEAGEVAALSFVQSQWGIVL